MNFLQKDRSVAWRPLSPCSQIGECDKYLLIFHSAGGEVKVGCDAAAGRKGTAGKLCEGKEGKGRDGVGDQ